MSNPSASLRCRFWTVCISPKPLGNLISPGPLLYVFVVQGPAMWTETSMSREI